MTLNSLNFIAQKLFSAGIPYCYEVWEKEISYPYFVGEYTESEPLYEDGESESTFILTGTTNGSWFELEQLKEKIHRLFTDAGLTAILSGNMAIAVMFSEATPIPTAVKDLKRIQINLKIKEWSVI